MLIGDSIGRLHEKRRKEKGPDDILIFERTVQTSTEVFSRLSLTEFGKGVAQHFYGDQYLKERGLTDFDITFWLRTKPDECYDRMRRRFRIGEERVSLDYLKMLQEAHKLWFGTRTDNCIQINGNRESFIVADEILWHIEKFISHRQEEKLGKLSISDA